jgi:DNA-binding MltR family transcriptional regulator
MAKKKLPSLRDITSEYISAEDLPRVVAELTEGSDRAATLVACTMVEVALREAIECRVINLNRDDYKSVFDSVGAPLGTFAARTLVAYAFGIIGPQTRSDLAIIRNVRNVFAHAMKPLDFNEPRVVKECKKLPTVKPSPFLMGHRLHEQRVQYTSVCGHLAKSFRSFVQKNRHSKITVEMI